MRGQLGPCVTLTSREERNMGNGDEIEFLISEEERQIPTIIRSDNITKDDMNDSKTGKDIQGVKTDYFTSETRPGQFK